ncbi:MAG TPA: hypothetical protein VNF68_02075 [Candidatus Baltobacteraceae bacterium]|nr:hypothetical protein [Candidatus Baltobacteraceae bacterium]
MSYVEWLRVRGCLKWAAIVLAVCVAIVLFGRFTYLDIRPHAELSGLSIDGQSFPQFERSSHETQAKLPNGTLETVIDNPKKGIRITIDDRGYWGKHIEGFIRHAPSNAELERFNFGDVHYSSTVVPGGTLVHVDEGASVPEDLAYYFVLAAAAAMIVATVLGAPFARENEGHLELALTKPFSRLGVALGMFGADAIGIVAVWVMTVVFMFVGHLIFEAPNFTYGPSDTSVIVVGLLCAFAWYAMLAAATASMKRAYGVVLGIAWPIAAVVHFMATANFGDAPLARLIHAAGTAIAFVDPTSYLRFGPVFVTSAVQRAQAPPVGSVGGSIPTELSILVLLVLVYGAIATIQWHRVEA